jgi:uncharacterized protein
MFNRKIEKDINEYLNGERDKILIIDGARQVGKTYIIRKLAQQKFSNYIEINLRDDFDNKKEFSKENVGNINDFYIKVSSLYGNKFNTKDDTIIFLDEIQVYPHLISMLKPLNQDNRFTYIVSGSLLGVTLKRTFIPMGSIYEVKMYPLDFEEFLWANGVGKEAIDYVHQCFNNKEKLTDGMHSFLLKKFKDFLICGGLPEAVKEFCIKHNFYKMREVHERTYAFYKDDCSQYDKEHKLKITRIYEMMPSYMENKVKRIQANKIRDNKKDTLVKYEDEFDYLVSSGVALSVKAVANPKFPLIESSSKNLIKLYYNDVGILTNILYKNNMDAILRVDKGVNLGSAYETAVAMELIAHDHPLYYFDSKKVGEVDFLINDYDNLSVLPIEVKSGKNMNNFRAIPKLVKKPYNLKRGIILNNKNEIKVEDKLITMPIYMVMFI